MAEKKDYLLMSNDDITKEIDGKTVRDVLSQIDCTKKIEKKNWFTYLSWAWAWSIVKKIYPDTSYDVVSYDWKDYLFDVNLWYLVHTKVTIKWETISMRLPIMDWANKSQSFAPQTYKVKEYKDKQWTWWYIDKDIEPATMFDVNTAIMRCLVKNLAMFWLWIYIYAWEDLPQQIIEKEDFWPKQLELIKKAIDGWKRDKNLELTLLSIQDKYNISDEQKDLVAKLFEWQSKKE